MEMSVSAKTTEWPTQEMWEKLLRLGGATASVDPTT